MYGLFGTNDHYKCLRSASLDDPIICNIKQTCPSVCRMSADGSLCKTGESLPALPVGTPEPKCKVILGQISGQPRPLEE
jgi:hypothetical protein